MAPFFIKLYIKIKLKNEFVVLYIKYSYCNRESNLFQPFPSVLRHRSLSEIPSLDRAPTAQQSFPASRPTSLFLVEQAQLFPFFQPDLFGRPDETNLVQPLQPLFRQPSRFTHLPLRMAPRPQTAFRHFRETFMLLDKALQGLVIFQPLGLQLSR